MKWFRQKKYASRRGWLAGIFCSVLAVTVMVAAVPLFTTHAETWEVQLDENGEAHDGSVHYKLEDGVLTVSGTGKIRYEAFYGYSGITSIVIESGITEIGGGAFRNTSLTSVTIPGNVKAINSDAFFQCKNLTALTIQEGVEVLGSSAFNQCEKLTSITLPSSVKEIYSYAFNFCPLINLTFQSSITNEQNSAVDFNYLAKTTLVHIPNDFKINGVTITPENKSEYFKESERNKMIVSIKKS